MSHGHEFEGLIEINGAIQSRRVSLFFSGHNVAINGAPGRELRKDTLHLHPFNVNMLRHPAPETMKSGFHHAIAGTDVGAFISGPLGHPGDGEFDTRQICRFELRVRYTADSLFAKIEGTTESGIAGMPEISNQPLIPWKFDVSFVVPRSEMKQFFGFNDFNYPFFEAQLDAC